MKITHPLRRITPGQSFGFSLVFTNLSLTEYHHVSIEMYTNRLVKVLRGEEPDVTGTDFTILRQGMVDQSRSVVFNITDEQCTALGQGSLFMDITVSNTNTAEVLKLNLEAALISGATGNKNCCAPCTCSAPYKSCTDELYIDVGMFSRLVVCTSPAPTPEPPAVVEFYRPEDAFFTGDISGVTYDMCVGALEAYNAGKVFVSPLTAGVQVQSIYVDDTYISAYYQFLDIDPTGGYIMYVQIQAHAESGVTVQRRVAEIQTIIL